MSIADPILDLAGLRAGFDGTVLGRDDQGYDAARRAFNLVVDQRPAAIAIPVHERDVAAVVRFARERGLRVAAQATGHNAGPLGSLEQVILVKTSEMRAAQIDVGERRARVAGGAQWLDVVPRASEHGLAALHGSAPDIGIAGYSLGGGVGWYARKLGLATNRLTAVELVTADGELVRADRDSEPELFWALRGGGGNFGIATALEFDLFPLSEVFAGVLFFPFDRAREVLTGWHAWVDGVPEEMTSVGRVLQFPPLPEVPEPVRGQSFAVVEIIYMGGEADGERLVQPLRELGPGMDTLAMVPPAALADLHMDPPEPVPYLSGHRLVGELPEKAIDDLLAVAGPGSGSPLLSVELRHTGGALARSEPGSGALASMPGSFAMFSVGAVFDEASAAAVQAQNALVMGALEPYDAGCYLGFVEEPTDMSMAYPADTYRRLEELRVKYDPEGIFKANHSIGAAG